MEEIKTKNPREKFFTTKNITVTAMLTAIAYVLYLFVKFPLPFFPPFLEIQFSDMPALIGGFMMGPIYGCIIIVIKCLLKLPFTHTFGVGELADILIGIAFVLPSALIYKKWRTRKGALIGLTFGGLGAIIMSMVANVTMLMPMYGSIFGWDNIIKMLTALFNNITRANFYAYYLPLAVLPFNMLRCLVCGLITFLLYKSLHRLIDTMFKKKRVEKIKNPDRQN